MGPPSAFTLSDVSSWGRPLATAALVAALLSACGSDDGKTLAPATGTAPPTTGAVSTTSPPAGPSLTVTEPGIDPLAGAGTDTVTVERAIAVAHLVAVRADRHEGFDRVVFEFDSAVPGYTVGYAQKPITEDGSGREVSIAGEHVVEVRMTPASGVNLDGEQVVPTYTGPTRFSPMTPEVAELVRTGDFEAVLTWAVGLRDRVDFRVTELTGPARLVVDLRNH